MANETTTTSLTELIPAEKIEEIVGQENRATPIYDFISWRKDMSQPGAGATWAVPAWDASEVPAGTKAETAEFTNVEATLSDIVITPGVVGLSRELTDPAAQDAKQNAEEMFLLNLRAMKQRLTTDLLALATSATNTSNFSGTNFDLDDWGACTAAFDAQFPYAGFSRVLLGHTNLIRDFKIAVRNSGASLEATGRGLGLLEMFEGQVYMFEGYTIVSSALLPQFDASNDSSMLVVVGNDANRTWSTLARGMWWDLKNEIERDAKKQTNNLITSARYGVGITKQANLREVVAKKAAA
jgi:hypothetical protein